MNTKNDRSTEGLGLLANGSSGRWDIAVDESLNQEAWFLEIDGPQVYLVFRLQDLNVVPRALRFLESGVQSEQGPRSRDTDDQGTLSLGQLGAAAVSLLWDNEDFPRCFIVIGPEDRCVLRLSLGAEDIPMFIEALRQVVNDIPQCSGE